MDILHFIQSVYNQALQQVSAALENETLMGMTVLGVVGGLVTAIGIHLRKVPMKIWKLFLRYTTMRIRVNKGDPYFIPLMAKISELHGESDWGSFISQCDIQDQNKTPSGLRWNRRGLCWFVINVVERELEHGNSYNAVTYSIYITVFGFRKKKKLSQLWKDALDCLHSQQLYIYRYRSYMERFCPLPQRPMNTVVTHVTHEIISDLQLFLKSKNWYDKHAIPYRRGLALCGPPGTGKTSIAIAIANVLKMNLVIIKLSTIDAVGLEKVFSLDNQIILIEDIDTYEVTHSRSINHANIMLSSKEGSSLKGVNTSNDQPITLSDILNAFDGATTGTNNIVIITSNHIDKIDSALLRPGRIENVYELSYLDQELFQQICQLYYGRSSTISVPEKLTAAEAQKIFIKNRNNFEDFQKKILEHNEYKIKSEKNMLRCLEDKNLHEQINTGEAFVLSRS